LSKTKLITDSLGINRTFINSFQLNNGLRKIVKNEYGSKVVTPVAEGNEGEVQAWLAELSTCQYER